MGSASVIRMSREEAEAELARLLGEVGMTIDKLRELADDYMLSAHDFARWRQIEDLTWLLGE